METLEVDGSYGEGGGQILRTAVFLSIALCKPIHVTRIRAGRDPPGLRQQHASALEILRSVSGGTLEGCKPGSSEVTFRPGRVAAGSLFFDLKTAASITLVLQAVVPAVALSGAEVRLELVGGTDVPWSPTFDYFAVVVHEAFSRIGLNFEAVALRRGYYPRGGGSVKVSIERGVPPKPVTLTNPPDLARATILSRSGSLPEHVARRQLEAATEALRSEGILVERSEFSSVQSSSPGSSILVYDLSGGRFAGSDGIGSKGKSSENVGGEAAENFMRTIFTGASVDSNLADMLAPILALANNESKLRIPGLTKHLETSLNTAQLFTGCRYSVSADGPSSVLTISPRASQ